MQKLYEFTFAVPGDRQQLYFNGDKTCQVDNETLRIDKDTKVDFLTYFNSFSVCKWKKYTTIKKLYIKGKIEGKALLEIVGLDGDGITITKSFHIEDNFEKEIDLSAWNKNILGLQITALSECVLHSLSYYGDFQSWQDLKIGIVICTFKREKYVKATMDKLQTFSSKNAWLQTLVVDNGSTLEQQELPDLCVIHNPNYGGSGGFTRGLIENLDRQENDYVLLMDDDIDLDTTVLERTHSLLCGLKKEYKESFLAGAMLRMDIPVIQHENTAYWNKIRLYGLGKNWNLTMQSTLINNEKLPTFSNQYGAWWYCCIPLSRVKEIGLPLPVFIKGDDMEYGIRNGREIISMNGIGVWHETFEGKQALWVNYFSDRNMLIINQYAAGCNRLTFFAAIWGRLVKRLFSGRILDIKMFSVALADMLSGFEKITSIPADKKLQSIREFHNQGNLLVCILKIVNLSFYGLWKYDQINLKYRIFREEKLKNKSFWLDYLKIGGM